MKIYIVLSVLNFLWPFKFANFEISTYLVFVLGVVLNQLFLVLAVKKITQTLPAQLQKIWMPSPLLLFGKFGILAGVFVFALSKNPKLAPFLVGIYIFQLIILVISNKRYIKKN